MRIGVAREIKRHEYRVAMTPACVRTYVNHGHKVMVETGAGAGAGYLDAEYRAAGAKVYRDKKKLTEALLRRGVTAIAYETIQLDDGSLPCLKPMSEIAGRLAVQDSQNQSKVWAKVGEANTASGATTPSGASPLARR